MSKQLKLKFKKILKKAEFINADLEYHQELSTEAKKLFAEAVRKLIDQLSTEEKAALNQKLEASVTPEEVRREVDAPKLISEELAVDENDCTALIKSDVKTEEPQDTTHKNKPTELKKLFRKIAECTHPDKVRADGFSEKEIHRLERVFKKAYAAYENNNWYILYSIASDLDLSIDDPNEEHIGWIEEDIQNTIAAINVVKSLVAWVWYTGDDQLKKSALRFYFSHIYDFTHPHL